MTSTGSEAADGQGAARSCGSCSLCCTVLRVDPLRKLAGVACIHQGTGAAGCGIHGSPDRPALCGAYRCAWLAGHLDAEDRPDALGAVLDLIAPAGIATLSIVEAREGAFDASPRLRAIAEGFRATMPVRVSTASDVLDPERLVRVFEPDGRELRVRGDAIEEWRDGELARVARAGFAERLARRFALAWQRMRVRGYPRAR